jgi:hypothetical protein
VGVIVGAGDVNRLVFFSGRTLEEALAWCLVWLMAPELGSGPFRV